MSRAGRSHFSPAARTPRTFHMHVQNCELSWVSRVGGVGVTLGVVLDENINRQHATHSCLECLSWRRKRRGPGQYVPSAMAMQYVYIASRLRIMERCEAAA